MAYNVIPAGFLGQTQPEEQKNGFGGLLSGMSSLGSNISDGMSNLGSGLGGMTPGQMALLTGGLQMVGSNKRLGPAISQALPGAMAAYQMGDKLMNDKEEKARKEKQRQAMTQWWSNPQVQQQMGVSPEMSPYLTEMAQNSPEMIPEILKGLKRGPGEFTALTKEQVKAAGLPENTVVYQGAEGWNVKMPAAGTSVMVGVGGDKYSPGDKEIDKAFASDVYIPWKSSDASNSASSIATLKGLMSDLADGKPISGPKVGLLQSFGGDTLASIFNPEAKDARDRVQGVVQASLKQILGGQFAAIEATQVLNRAFDPTLDPKVNARRVSQLLGKMEGAHKSKQAMVDYYDTNRTLSGYRGPQVSIQDFIELDQKWSAEDTKGTSVNQKPIPFQEFFNQPGQ